MPYKSSFGTMPAGDPIEAPQADSRFRIAVLADFSGRQNRGETDSLATRAARRLVRVGRENLDEVMANLAVRLELPVGDIGPAINLSFASLDDFHPNQIHDKVSYIADADDSASKSGWMNWVLHHPDFQALESTWRGLDWLLARTAKGGKVEALLLDISHAELSADLMDSETLADSQLHQFLIEKGVRGSSGEPWAAFVGNYAFELSGEHAELLGRLAKIAGQANAPFLTTVNPEVLGRAFAFSPDAAPAWQALRQLPEAALLGLSVPRFLLRLPYGENTQPIDKFSFEEMSLPPDRNHYLWGNPAFGCAALLAQAFLTAGWGCQPGAVRELENLPIHVYSLDGEEQVTLAEAWLLRPQAVQLVKNGIMLFECIRGKGALRLLRFQSLAQPAKDQAACDLQGHWSQSSMAPVQQVAAPLAPKVGLVAQSPPPRPRPADPPAVSSPAAQAAPASKPAATAPAAKPAPAAQPAAPAASAPAAKAAPAPPPEEPPVEEEMDPELAALLKELE